MSWYVLTDGVRDVAGNALTVPAATIIPVMATSSAAAVTVAAAGPASSTLASSPEQELPGVSLGASAAALTLADSSNTPAVGAACLFLCVADYAHKETHVKSALCGMFHGHACTRGQPAL